MSSLIPLDTFLPQILVEVPECPEPVAINAIRSAIIELCDTALVWREDVEPFTLTPGQAVYDIDTPPQARVSTIIDIVTDDTRKLMAVDREWLFRFDPLWAQREGSVNWYLQPDPETIQFVRVPYEEETIFMHCAYSPTRAGNSVPGYIFEQYLDAVRYGAWQRLMAQPSKPWTNLKVAGDYARWFSAAVSKYRIEVTKGRVRTNSTVQPRPFA